MSLLYGADGQPMDKKLENAVRSFLQEWSKQESRGEYKIQRLRKHVRELEGLVQK